MGATVKEALVLVAHADDESLGAGGTIPLLCRQDWRVQVVIVSDGHRFGGHGQSNRSMASKACATLGVHDLHFLDYPDQQFDTIPMAHLVEKVLGLGLSPDLVITHADQDLNMDHRLVAEAARIVARPRRKPVGVLAVEIPNTAFWNGRPFTANFYVDISATLETKVAAFAKYVHEIQPFPQPWSIEGLRLLAQYHGMQAGVPFAEAFTLVRGYDGLLPGCPGARAAP